MVRERRERDCHVSPRFAVVQNPISLYSFMHLTAKIKLKIFLHYSLHDTLLPIIFKIVLGNDSVKFLEQSSKEEHLTLYCLGAYSSLASVHNDTNSLFSH